MTKIHHTQCTFNAGELSPNLWGRADIAKYQQGCKVLKNFIPLVQGAANRRRGTYFITELLDATGQPPRYVRIVPFEFSRTESYVIEFQDKFCRFHFNGEPLYNDDGSFYTIQSPYLGPDLRGIQFTQSADVLYMAHRNYPVFKLMRFGHKDWVIKPVKFSADMVKRITGIEKTKPAKLYCPEHNYDSGDTVYIYNGGGPAQLTSGYYTLNTVDDVAFTLNDTDASEWDLYGGFAVCQKVTRFRDNDKILNSKPIKVNLQWNPYQDGDVVLFQRVRGMEEINGRTFLVFNSDAGSFELKNLDGSLSDSTNWGSHQPASGDTALVTERFAMQGHFPGCIEFYQQRLMLASTYEKPQSIWGSVVGDYEKFNFGPQDDMAIGVTVAAHGVNEIKWLVPGRALIVGTSNAEWIMESSNVASVALAPSDVSIKRFSSWGSEDIQALLVDTSVVFVQKGGLALREIAYSFEADGFVANDLNALSDYILRPGVVSLGFSRNPYPLIYCVKKDGTAAVMLYDRRQQVHAWSRIETEGLIQDVAVIAYHNMDDIYFVVRRGSRVFLEYITYHRPHVFLDSAVVWKGFSSPVAWVSAGPPMKVVTVFDPPDDMKYIRLTGTGKRDEVYRVKSISGRTITLDADGSDLPPYEGGGRLEEVRRYIECPHLIGKRVLLALDDWHSYERGVPGNGYLDDFPFANKIAVGLPYESFLETMDLSPPGPGGPTLGLKSRVTGLGAILYDCAGFEVRRPDGGWQSVVVPNYPFSGHVRVDLFPGDFDYAHSVAIRTKGAFSLKVNALLLDMELAL